MPPPIHRYLAHDPSKDKPIVRPLRDLYQADRKFSTLFAKDGHSELCGPTALSNVLLYMKHTHQPQFPKLLDHIEDTDKNAHDVVEYMFRTCHANGEIGSSSKQLQHCAGHVVKSATANSSGMRKA